MPHPGILAILVGVAIGTTIYYCLNFGNAQTFQYNQNNDNQFNQNRYSPNNTPKYKTDSSRRRRRISNDECAICQELNTVSTTYKMENCSHEFHNDCIKKWLKVKKDCPICRAEVL